MKQSSFRGAVLSVSIPLLTVVSALAQNSSNDLSAQLEHLHSQWLAAFDNGDGATMDRMEVPNLMLVNADGKGGIWQKSSSRAGKQKPSGVLSRSLSNARVREFGDFAILTGLLTSRTKQETHDASTTVVWIRQSRQWLIVSAQWSAVARTQK